MTRLLLILLTALVTGVAGATPPPEGAASGPTPYPTNTKDWPGQGAIRVFGWMTENRKAFWPERERKQGAVVFAGDSLIGGWRTMAKDFPELNVANRGIGGEPTRGLLFRFQEDVLDLHPKAIVLLSGSNDLSAQQDPKQSRANLAAMLDQAEKAAPGVPIVLCTVPPRQDPKAPVDPAKVRELNRQIASLAEGRRNVVVLDLHALLVAPDGSPTPELFGADRLHISAAGFQRFRDALAPVLKQLNVS
ncbi:MAG: GDSL-type esterase/lipase family protein [Rhizobacter sp.]